MSNPLVALAALPGKQLQQALINIGIVAEHVVTMDKAALVKALGKMINDGQITLDAVRKTQWAFADTGQPMTVSPAIAPTPAYDEKIGAAHTRLDNVDVFISRLSVALNKLDTRAEAIEHDVQQASKKAADAMAEAARAHNAIPSLDAQTRLNELVNEAFADFRRVVEEQGKQAEVMDVISLLPTRKKVGDVFGILVYDLAGRELEVDVYDNPGAPSIDPNFIWTPTVLRHLLLAQDNGENLWFGGDKGTGKSETARQFAARTGRPYTRINFHKYTEAADYLGSTGIVGGDTAFTKGDFLMAFTTPGAVILLDEPSNIDPGEAAPLNGFLEPNSAVSWGGSVWRKAPGVVVFAADNTMGSGDDSGRYAGTRTQNSALIDRFARVIKFDYLPLDEEIDAVVRHTGCRRELAAHVIDAVRAARAEVEKANIVDAPSIRSVLAFIRSVAVLGVEEAWATAVTNRQPTESGAALEAIRMTFLNEEAIKQYI